MLTFLYQFFENMKRAFNRKIQKIFVKRTDCLLAVTSVEQFQLLKILTAVTVSIIFQPVN